MHRGNRRRPGRIHFILVEILLALAAAVAIVYVVVCQPFAAPTKDRPPSPVDTKKANDVPDPKADVPPGLPIVAWGNRHHFPEIRNPWYVRADDEAHAPADDDPVLGVVIKGQARAYSTNQLNDHEMVIDELSGVPILVTY